jgi:hypothetical protein
MSMTRVQPASSATITINRSMTMVVSPSHHVPPA